MCGHFPEGVETFEKRSIEGETRGEWYLRQMLGSANISGSKALHILTGNLSHQVEHHLYPDRSEEHTSELQSCQYLVCRLLLEKKKKTKKRRSVINRTATSINK